MYFCSDFETQIHKTNHRKTLSCIFINLLKTNAMKENSFFLNIVYTMMLCLTVFSPTFSQTILYAENFGTPTANTLIQNYTGWQNRTVIYTGDGTCDVRTSSASNSYGLASGGGNVMINDTVKWFMISGLNTAGYSDLSLYCGLRKTNAENGSNFVVEVSEDSLVWTRVFLSDTMPSGTGTSGWRRVRYLNIPSTGNLHIRFSNLAHVDYRLDDIAIVVGEETVLETVAKPTFSPGGGTYYEPKTVTITSATPGAVIYYTFDNSAPADRANQYMGPLTINSSVTLKAIATGANMYDSEVATATYTILDTNSLVELPFDISNNSSATRLDITTLHGFRGYHLGSSYADGSAKFETSHAGEASLVAHLDSAPDTLVFELKGVNGGSNPAAYEGITFTVSYSTDGHNWTTLATLFSDDITVGEYTRFTYVITDHNARHLRWRLESSTKGNTQLNNIKITQYNGNGDGDSTSVATYFPETFSIYPNPAKTSFSVHQGRNTVRALTLYNIIGQTVRTWNNPTQRTYNVSDLPRGTYFLKADTPNGTIQKKLVLY